MNYLFRMTTKTKQKFLFFNSILGIFFIAFLEIMFEKYSEGLIVKILELIGFLLICSPWVFLLFRKIKGVSFKSTKALGFSSVSVKSLKIHLDALHFADFVRYRELYYAYFRKEADKEIFIFSNHMAKGSGGETVFLVNSSELNLPWFILHEETTADDLIYNALNGFSGGKVQFTKFSGFAKTFRVETTRESNVRILFEDGKVRNAFMAFGEDDLYFEGNADCFLVHRYRLMGFKEQQRTLKICRNLFEALRKER